MCSPGLHGRQFGHKTAQGKILFVAHGKHGHVLILSGGLEVSPVTYPGLRVKEMLMLWPQSLRRCHSGSCLEMAKRMALLSLDRLAQCQE